MLPTLNPTPENKLLCIYHDNCADGMAAAFAVRQRFSQENVELLPASYGEPAPDESLYAGRDVMVVDFSFPEAGMLAMADKARTVTVIDHHKTAQAVIQPMIEAGTVHGIFNMEKSGCVLTWEALFPLTPMPETFRFIQDYDLWVHRYEDSMKVVHGLMSYPMEFKTWEPLLWAAGDDLKQIRDQGAAILRAERKHILAHLKKNQGELLFEGYRIPCCNVPHAWTNTAAEIMYQDADFSATFTVSGDQVNISLRCRRGAPFDLGDMARNHGGGGHESSAGCYMSLDEFFANWMPRD